MVSMNFPVISVIVAPRPNKLLTLTLLFKLFNKTNRSKSNKIKRNLIKLVIFLSNLVF